MLPGEFGRMGGPRNGGRGLRRAALIVALLLCACQPEGPPLPDAAPREVGRSATVPAPEIPGRSDAFENMELPPGQIVRVDPVGGVYGADDAPVFRGLCLQCHAVSQTSFAVQAWKESAHSRAGITCGSCHGAHEGTFVTKPGPERCRSCHATQYDQVVVSGHGPERAPGMGCSPCHEVHATDRRLAARVETCVGCHLESEHVRGYATSRMGILFLREGYGADGELRAPDCVYCHMPPITPSGPGFGFRNDRVSLHDPTRTVGKHPADPTRLAAETVEFLVPLCVKCHSERNARYRLENSALLLRTWTPIGMTEELRRKPWPAGGAGNGPTAGASNGATGADTVSVGTGPVQKEGAR